MASNASCISGCWAAVCTWVQLRLLYIVFMRVVCIASLKAREYKKPVLKCSACIRPLLAVNRQALFQSEHDMRPRLMRSRMHLSGSSSCHTAKRCEVHSSASHLALLLGSARKPDRVQLRLAARSGKL